MMTLTEQIDVYASSVEDEVAQYLMAKASKRIKALEAVVAVYSQMSSELTDLAEGLAYELEIWGDKESDAYQMWSKYVSETR
jgi:hypothetical protein